MIDDVMRWMLLVLAILCLANAALELYKRHLIKKLYKKLWENK